MKTARVAGIQYIVTDLFMIFSGMVVSPKIYVPGDDGHPIGQITQRSLGILRAEWELT